MQREWWADPDSGDVSGPRAAGCGQKAWNTGCRMRAEGLEHGLPDAGRRLGTRAVGCGPEGAEHGLPDAGQKAWNTGCRMQGRRLGTRAAGCGSKSADHGLWTGPEYRKALIKCRNADTIDFNQRQMHSQSDRYGIPGHFDSGTQRNQQIMEKRIIFDTFRS